MLQQIHKRRTRCAVGATGLGTTAAAHLTIPKLKFPVRKVRSEGDPEEIAAIISELSRRLRLDDILANHHIPSEALEQSFRKWFSGFIVPEIDALIDADVTFFPVGRDWDCDDEYGDAFPENGWVFLFTLLSVDYETFDITRQVCEYEKRVPGLGQYLLQMIDQTPYEFATPAYMKSIISYFLWNGLDDEKEFAEDYSGGDEEEYQAILESVPVKLEDLENNIPAWALVPREICPAEIPAEIAVIKTFAPETEQFKHMVYPYNNLPAILLWEEKRDLWYDTLVGAETDAMEAGVDIRFCGRYWPMPLDNPHLLQEVFDEIEAYVSGFYKVLQAIYNIKKMVTK